MSSKTIFVVEDDSKVSFLIEFLLKRAGYQVTKAEDGNEASNYIASVPKPDLVLLDLMLPYKDGFQLLSEIRSSALWKPTPVVVLSALAQGKDISKCLADGANDYLVKPFQPDELLARVNKFLELKSA